MRMRTLGIVLLLCCCATSGFAADRVIQNGVDLWRTTEDGSTFISLAKTPIPAGFFCAGSAPFAGKIALRGEPLVTDVPGALGRADTIVQRLDNAAFNKRGQAVTRLQFRALSLKSLTPIETTCGKFDAAVRLDGVQPVTRMVITRRSEDGGTFSAPLALNVMVSFTPVGRVSSEVLEIPVEVRFPANPNFPWRTKTVVPMPDGFVKVDTDGDRVPDTYVPGTSNFLAGQSARGAQTKGYYCHPGDDPAERHCVYLCSGCAIP